MPRRPVSQSLDEQLETLFRVHPKAEEWTAEQIAEHLGRNPRSVKEHPRFRALLAERQGVDLTGPELAALNALAAVGTNRPATAAEVAGEAGKSEGLIRRRLATLRERGYAAARPGDPSTAGYRVTPNGLRALRASQPRRKRGKGK